jgi:hypothetical protein
MPRLASLGTGDRPQGRAASPEVSRGPGNRSPTAFSRGVRVVLVHDRFIVVQNASLLLLGSHPHFPQVTENITYLKVATSR